MMEHDVTALALNPAALARLAQHPKLSGHLRRQLEQAIQRLDAIAEVTKAKQDAVSAIHLHGIWKAQETLELVELVRLCRSPLVNVPEWAAFQQSLRQDYLEQVKHIVSRGARAIVDGGRS